VWGNFFNSTAWLPSASLRYAARKLSSCLFRLISLLAEAGKSIPLPPDSIRWAIPRKSPLPPRNPSTHNHRQIPPSQQTGTMIPSTANVRIRRPRIPALHTVFRQQGIPLVKMMPSILNHRRTRIGRAATVMIPSTASLKTSQSRTLVLRIVYRQREIPSVKTTPSTLNHRKTRIGRAVIAVTRYMARFQTRNRPCQVHDHLKLQAML
jgi:hypothetical protein